MPGPVISLNERHRDFFDAVFQVVRLVPEGRVTTFGAIAAYLGAKRSARMVGWAMNVSHRALPPVPAQRVVNSSGLLTGKFHFSTPTEMEELLRAEGVAVENNKVVNFRERFWDPAKELE